MKSTVDKIRDGQVWILGVFGETVGGTTTGHIGFTTGDVFSRMVNRKVTTDSASGSITLYKDSPYSGGTSITIKSRNQRDSANGFLPPLNAERTVTPDSALDPAKIIGSVPVEGTNQTLVDKEVDAKADIIFLEKNTSYIIAAENLSANPSKFHLSAVFESEEPIT